MKLQIPEFSLVILIGTSGSGKSIFANKHFLPTEVISSDYCRKLVADDENDQSATNDAFDVLRYITAKRLAAKRLTVIDATNVKREDRRTLLNLAREYDCLPIATVLNLPIRVCFERNQNRANRPFGIRVIQNQHRDLRRSLRSLKREGFNRVFVLNSEEDVAGAEIVKRPLWNDKRHEKGPFDIIGDVHGCCDELEQLLDRLGYTWAESPNPNGTYHRIYSHPADRKAVFVGDLVDRGPRILDTVQLVRNMLSAGSALCVPGNHDVKLVHKLSGRNVQIKHGLAETMSEIGKIDEEIRPAFLDDVKNFLKSLISHYVFDDGKLVVAHAGLTESLQGRASGRVREFALYGETTGETDEFGLPIRYDWAQEYRGDALVVYGHTPVPDTEWLNNTINIDTGCVFGGRLTALRYPEKELISVPAAKEYANPIRPLQSPKSTLTSQQVQDDLLNIDDVIGKRIINTRLRKSITIREENSIAALEVMSRYAVDPKWLIYLPPTMAPTETSSLPDFLEHPAEAFQYFQKMGVETAVCEEKHMGSRAIVIVCRDSEVTKSRFGILSDDIGVCYTRTGRRFFEDRHLENELLHRLQNALQNTGFWDEFDTDWVCLDCELMPWSAKAQALLQQQYAAVGASAAAAMSEVEKVLAQSMQNDVPVADLQFRFATRQQSINSYINAYRQYCWPVHGIEDLRLAPFHILATENNVHTDKTHSWHMGIIEKYICSVDDPCFFLTKFRLVQLTDEESKQSGVDWWLKMTQEGGEGMVVKSLDFIATGKKGVLQPAIKCRGREYLRIIYGPEYTTPNNLDRLRNRSVARKRSLALREFALGVEALERFVREEPLRLIHECVFGVLALESESVDPRL
ncbi:MAG: polynucleotide kinase-phosphatase [Anaerolineales bacterium]|nr:polynucleotide kinase-phosphatase [Anaerolineales bacterium]MCA9928053.1 polynucleotide kinase-phosphatase [Anaerolineales bacterium]